MTWQKHRYRYHPQKLVHQADGESWTHFDGIHDRKAREAYNIRVALAIDRFNPYEMGIAPYTWWPVFVIPSISLLCVVGSLLMESMGLCRVLWATVHGNG